MAQAEHQEKCTVSKDKFFTAVTRYEEYPKFVDGISKVSVERKGPGKARASYVLQMMGQEMTYVLDHVEDPVAGTVKWTLVESNFFKKNDGSWKIVASGDGACQVVYSLDVEFKVAVPGFILNRLVKGSLPAMVKGFEKRAKS